MMRGRIREWVILGVCLTVGAILMQWARSSAQEAYAQRQAREIAEDSVATLWVLFEERNVQHQLVVDSITEFFVDSIQVLTLLPPELPHTDAEHLALLDTAQLAREVREALDLVLAENDSLRARERFYRTRLSEVEILMVRAVDSLNTYWSTVRQADLELIEQQRVTIREAVAEAERFEKAYLAQRLSFLDRLVWVGVGAGAMWLGQELLDDDGPEYVYLDTHGEQYQRAWRP